MNPRRLLEKATSLPWGDPDDLRYGDFGWYIPGSPLGETEDTEQGRADAMLAVYAVNRLPNHLAAVSALERLIDNAAHVADHVSYPALDAALVVAREVRDRVRGES